MAARAVAAARHALSRAQPQAGVADRVGRVAAQPERHGAGLVRRPARRARHRRAARSAARDAPDVGRRGRAPPPGARPGSAGRHPDVPAGRDRRVTGRRAARRGDAPGDQSDRRDVRPGRGGRRPDLGRRGRDDVGRGARRIGGRRRRGEARRLRLGDGRDDLERRDRGPPRRARLDARGGRDRHRWEHRGVVR